MNSFTVVKSDGTCKARAGVLKTDHSEIQTPVFMPVGTLGTVKAVEQRELTDMDASIILGNTYHLYLRPGNEVMKAAGGLHRFMNWQRSLLTDSGGFQVFSLTSLRKVKDEGVEFSSHLDGSKHFFSPEKVIDTERIIGSDIMMPLDICMPNPSEHKDNVKALEITHNWETRCLHHFKNTDGLYGHRQMLFSICQGSTFEDLRVRSIETLAAMDFDGNAIGGLAVGEPNEQMYDIVDLSTNHLPEDKPRYLMGVGTPVDILENVERGVDMFDCVMPTRNARHGRLFTSHGEINIKNAKYKSNFDSPDEEYPTYTSKNFSLSYLRHLFISGEILGMQLASIHNIGFYLEFMKRIRFAILEGRFKEFKKSFLDKYLNNK